MKVVGQGLNRVDAYGKVTGEAKYSADLEPRDILHGKVIHSTIANGLVNTSSKIVTIKNATTCPANGTSRIFRISAASAPPAPQIVVSPTVMISITRSTTRSTSHATVI